MQVSICATPVPGPGDAHRGLRGACARSKPGREGLNALTALVGAGQLCPELSMISSLRQAKQAHELIQSSHTRGKILLRIEDL